MVDTCFVEELASAAPAPGGGGASAYVGALAAALASMVGNLTVGKKTYAEVEGEVVHHLEELGDLRERLIALVEEDARAFKPLAAAYRMPKGTPEELAAKQDAIQRALVGATEVPLDIMRTVARMVDHADYLRTMAAEWPGRTRGFRLHSPGRGRWRKLERVYQRGFDGRPRKGAPRSRGGFGDRVDDARALR